MDIINDNLLSQENINILIESIEADMYEDVPVFDPENPYSHEFQRVKRMPTTVEISLILILKHLKKDF